jgi:type II secretory pathway component PulM
MNWKERLNQLSPREKKLLLAGAACLLAVLGWLWFFQRGRPGRSVGSRLDQAIAQEKQTASLLATYQQENSQLRAVEDRLRQTPADFDLYKHLDQLVDQAGIRMGVIKMDPVEGAGTEYYSEDYVDMNLQKVEFQPLIRFLQSVEDSPGGVRITNLSLKKRFDNSNTLDATIRVSLYRLKEGGT